MSAIMILNGNFISNFSTIMLPGDGDHPSCRTFNATFTLLASPCRLNLIISLLCGPGLNVVTSAKGKTHVKSDLFESDWCFHVV